MAGTSIEADRRRLEAIVGELVHVLKRVAGEELSESFETSGPQSIRRLGLTSVRTLEYLVELEDQLGIEWDEGLRPDTLASFEGMAEFVLAWRLGR